MREGYEGHSKSTASLGRAGSQLHGYSISRMPVLLCAKMYTLYAKATQPPPFGSRLRGLIEKFSTAPATCDLHTHTLPGFTAGVDGGPMVD